MKRRDFFRNAAAVAAGTALTTAVPLTTRAAGAPRNSTFNLNYAPHPNMFKDAAGADLVDQIKYASDQGFTAWEDNGMKGRSLSDQKRVGKALADLNMKMGVFVAHGSIGRLTFAKKDEATWNVVLKDIRDSVDVARRVGSKWMTVVPGNADEDKGGRLAPGYQMANVIELLRRCADIFEPHGLVMVLEPLNWFANHGGVFLRYADQAYALCKAVNSPACKILFDIYHQQITEGNLIPNISRCWDEIGYFQSGDNPGRKEPGTGEINYRNVFKHIYDLSKKEGREYIIGMEHGVSGSGIQGEKALVQAYRNADNF